MRLDNCEHTSQPWRIHELTRDFRLEDVWALPTPGGPDDFKLLVREMTSAEPGQMPSRAARLLWALRWKIGEVLRLDRPSTGLGSRVASLRERLPDDLRDTPPPDFGSLPFTPLYVTDNEFAGEIANETMHGVMHVGWVEAPDGSYRGQMAVLVKPNGLFGAAYMAAIKPFRYLIVYPAMLAQIERRWQSMTGRRVAAPV
jgi:hypothetical protein